MPIVSVEKLRKQYKDKVAVDDISFTVQEGELFAFLGENGAGKSTTINMLCTILSKTAGTAVICGHELGREDDAIRRDIGIVFQNSVLDGKLTVRQNLATRGSFYNLPAKTIDERLREFDKYFELSEIWSQRYETLSGGQRRRVDICRALLHSPRLLFLDEPTTGLDPKSRQQVWNYIDALRRERHMTIFLTTHYMEETRNADHVVIIDHGHVIARGTPAELKNKYAPGKFIWYTPQSSDAESLIRTIPGSHNPAYAVDHYIVPIDGTAGAITDFLYRNKKVVTDYEVIKGSMDDVFLTLTGRRMA